MKYVVSLILFINLFGCGSGPEKPTASQASPVNVTVAPVERSPLGGETVYSGTVEAETKVTVSTRISGWIEHMAVKEGDHVGRNDLLIRLRDTEAKAQLAQAEAAIEAARAQFTNAQTNLKRIEALFKDRAATQKELDDMRTAFKTARAHLEAARQQKKAALEMLAYTEIRSPMAGVVSRRFADPGDLATPGHPLLVLEDTRRVKIVASVSESAVQAIVPGTAVQVHIPSAGTGWIQGTVTRLVPGADPQTHQFNLEVVLANPKGRIQSGVFARVKVASSGETALVIPRKALFRRGQLEGVYTVKDSVAHLRWVKTGRVDGTHVEVLSGLEEGEQVVLDPAPAVRDGQPVVPVAASAVHAREERP